VPRRTDDETLPACAARWRCRAETTGAGMASDRRDFAVLGSPKRSTTRPSEPARCRPLGGCAARRCRCAGRPGAGGRSAPCRTRTPRGECCRMRWRPRFRPGRQGHGAFARSTDPRRRARPRTPAQ
jgi:hypothetical protein